MGKSKIKVLSERGRRFTPHDPKKKPPEQQQPTFSLTYLDKKYCLSNCDKKEKAAFADTLHKLSQLTWAEIKRAPRHGLGYEKIKKESIKGSIPHHLSEDVNFIAFRFCSKAPMVGYRDGRTFYIVWLDRAFCLYDHGN